MFRSLPVGNKVCAARVRKRYEDQRAQRLREMKPQIDAAAPQTSSMKHLKHNWKRDEIQAQRHDTIERNDRAMINKMYEFARKPEYSVKHSSSLPALRAPGGPAQQREYDRIMQANALMLKRLRGMEPEIKARKWEEEYGKSQDYVRIGSEYPLCLHLKKKGPRHSPSRAGLTRLPSDPGATGSLPQGVPVGGRAGSHTTDEAFSEPSVVGAELRYVLREDRPIMGTPFSVEMATDGSALAISIYDVEGDFGLELLLNGENHRALHQECGGCYAALAERLRIEGDQLYVAPLEGQMPPPPPMMEGQPEAATFSYEELVGAGMPTPPPAFPEAGAFHPGAATL